MQESGNESLTLNVPSETTLLDIVSTVIAAIVSPEAGLASGNSAPSANNRFGLDLLFLPFKKDPVKKVFDLLSLIKLVKIPATSTFADPGSMMFYSLLPSMLPTLMATGLFLYGVYNHDTSAQPEGTNPEGYDYYDSSSFNVNQNLPQAPLGHPGGSKSDNAGFYYQQPSRQHSNQGNYQEAFKSHYPGGHSVSNKHSGRPAADHLDSKPPGGNRYPPYGYLYRNNNQNSDQQRQPTSDAIGNKIARRPTRPGSPGGSSGQGFNHQTALRKDRNRDQTSNVVRSWQQNQHERREAPPTSAQQSNAINFARTNVENGDLDELWRSVEDSLLSTSLQDSSASPQRKTDRLKDEFSLKYNSNDEAANSRWSELSSDGSRPYTSHQADVFRVIDAPQQQQQVNQYSDYDTPAVVYSRAVEDEARLNENRESTQNLDGSSGASTSYKVSSGLGYHFPHADSPADNEPAVMGTKESSDSHEDQYIENHQPYHGYRRKTTM